MEGIVVYYMLIVSRLDGAQYAFLVYQLVRVLNIFPELVCRLDLQTIQNIIQV